MGLLGFLQSYFQIHSQQESRRSGIPAFPTPMQIWRYAWIRSQRAFFFEKRVCSEYRTIITGQESSKLCFSCEWVRNFQQFSAWMSILFMDHSRGKKNESYKNIFGAELEMEKMFQKSPLYHWRSRVLAHCASGLAAGVLNKGWKLEKQTRVQLQFCDVYALNWILARWNSLLPYQVAEYEAAGSNKKKKKAGKKLKKKREEIRKPSCKH